MKNFLKITLILKIIRIEKLKLNSTLKKFNVEQRVLNKKLYLLLRTAFN